MVLFNTAPFKKGQMSLDYSTPTVEAPPPAEDLIPEAKSHARRRHWVQAVSGLLVMAVAATSAFLVFDKADKTAIPTTRVSPAAWAAAKTTCDHLNLSFYGGTPHLYGAYPTTVRLALNWPTKIYPRNAPVTPTTINAGTHPVTRSNDGWPPGFNTSRPADICIFTGRFAFRPPSMQGSHGPVDHAKVLLIYLMDIPPMTFRNASITPLNSIPSRPVPVAVSTP